MLRDNIMSTWSHPLDLASGIASRLVLAAALLAALWAAIAWALAA